MIRVTRPTPPAAAPTAAKRARRSLGRTHLADAFRARADENPASAQTPPNRLDAVCPCPAPGTTAFGSVHFKNCFHCRLLLACIKSPGEPSDLSIHRASKPLSCLGSLVFVKYGRGLVLLNTPGWKMIPHTSPCSQEGPSYFILNFKTQTSTSHTAPPSTFAF